MATRKEIQFRSKINKLLKDADKLDAQALRRTNQLLFDMKKRINARLANEALEGWDLTHLPRLKIAMNQVVSEFQRQYNNALNSFTTEAFEKGIELVDEPMRIAYETFALPELSRQTLGIMQGYSADLVVGVSNDVRRWINSELTLGITGEKSPFQIMQGIGKKVKGYAWEKGTPMDKAMRRAEVITRTEISRVLNLSTWKRQEQLSENYPETKKYWIQFPSKYPRDVHRSVMNETNPESGGTPIPINQDYIVGTERAKAPHDPRLSAKNVIQCGCRSVIWMPEFEIAEKPVEEKEVIEFVPAKTVKDAEVWARKNNIDLSIDKNVNTNMMLNIINSHDKAINKIGSFNIRTDNIGKKINIFEQPLGNNIAISFNKGYSIYPENVKKALKLWAENAKDIKNNIKPIDLITNLEDTIIHECGHNLYGTLSPKIKNYWEKYYLNKGISIDNVPSFYAQENASECFAESFLGLIKGINSNSINELKKILDNL